MLFGTVKTLNDVVDDLKIRGKLETTITIDHSRSKHSGFEAYVALQEGEFKFAEAYFKDNRKQGAYPEEDWVKAVHYSALHEAREFKEKLGDRGITATIKDKIYGNQ